MGGKEIPSCHAYMIDVDVIVRVCICINKCRQFPSPHLVVCSFLCGQLVQLFFFSLLGLPFKLHAQLPIQSLSLERRVSFESITLLNVTPLFNYLSLKLKIYHTL